MKDNGKAGVVLFTKLLQFRNSEPNSEHPFFTEYLLFAVKMIGIIQFSCRTARLA